MPEFLTYARTLALLREVVAEVGEDYVCPKFPDPLSTNEDLASCRYVHGGEPSCIAARVLHRAGVSVAELEQLEDIGADDFVTAPQLLDWADRTSLLLLGCVQEEQDNGVPWGQAVRNGVDLLQVEATDG